MSANKYDACATCHFSHKCAVKENSSALKLSLCDKYKKEKEAYDYFEAEHQKYYQESLKQLEDKNFDTNYCQKCAIRKSCALMKLKESARQQYCFDPRIKEKVKVDIDASLLTPTPESWLN